MPIMGRRRFLGTANQRLGTLDPGLDRRELPALRVSPARAVPQPEGGPGRKPVGRAGGSGGFRSRHRVRFCAAGRLDG